MIVFNIVVRSLNVNLPLQKLWTKKSNGLSRSWRPRIRKLREKMWKINLSEVICLELVLYFIPLKSILTTEEIGASTEDVRKENLLLHDKVKALGNP
jgi:hypothetical protein